MVLSSMPEAVAGGAKHGATWREYMAIVFWWQPAVVLCSCGGGVGGRMERVSGAPGRVICLPPLLLNVPGVRLPHLLPWRVRSVMLVLSAGAAVSSAAPPLGPSPPAATHHPGARCLTHHQRGPPDHQPTHSTQNTAHVSQHVVKQTQLV